MLREAKECFLRWLWQILKTSAGRDERFSTMKMTVILEKLMMMIGIVPGNYKNRLFAKRNGLKSKVDNIMSWRQRLHQISLKSCPKDREWLWDVQCIWNSLSKIQMNTILFVLTINKLLKGQRMTSAGRDLLPAPFFSDVSLPEKTHKEKIHQ